jgi:hypothetical protein
MLGVNGISSSRCHRRAKRQLTASINHEASTNARRGGNTGRTYAPIQQAVTVSGPRHTGQARTTCARACNQRRAFA